jgi:hypothetical protein
MSRGIWYAKAEFCQAKPKFLALDGLTAGMWYAKNRTLTERDRSSAEVFRKRATESLG